MGLDTNLDKVSGTTPEKDLADEIAERSHLHLYPLFVLVIYFLLERESIEIEVKVRKGLPEGLPSLGQNTGTTMKGFSKTEETVGTKGSVTEERQRLGLRKVLTF
ncbi:hypothetical protein QQP08_003952 [Theobroma cacao]|nr:hypothetical protein QQP08_003952 [Theobroma cacao]